MHRRDRRVSRCRPAFLGTRRRLFVQSSLRIVQRYTVYVCTVCILPSSCWEVLPMKPNGNHEAMVEFLIQANPLSPAMANQRRNGVILNEGPVVARGRWMSASGSSLLSNCAIDCGDLPMVACWLAGWLAMEYCSRILYNNVW